VAGLGLMIAHKYPCPSGIDLPRIAPMAWARNVWTAEFGVLQMATNLAGGPASARGQDSRRRRSLSCCTLWWKVTVTCGPWNGCGSARNRSSTAPDPSGVPSFTRDLLPCSRSRARGEDLGKRWGVKDHRPSNRERGTDHRPFLTHSVYHLLPEIFYRVLRPEHVGKTSVKDGG
jgi:hypothetical protein